LIGQLWQSLYRGAKRIEEDESSDEEDENPLSDTADKDKDHKLEPSADKDKDHKLEPSADKDKDK